MIFGKKKPSTDESWVAVRNELKQLRGRNLLRAREEAFPARDQLILYDEHRGGLRQSYWVVTVTASLDDLSASHVPTGKTLSVQSLGKDAFFLALAEALRQKPYLKSQRKGTTYR